jgi:NADH:ubiquinone oxidoreductase subunit 5 (subunit L)/multisubunit Na+/H+ antiporter MnhA subunit
MLGSVGALSAVHGTLVSKTRSERKGALANATSATVGLIFVTLACGYPDLALLMSFGHSAFRMRQIMRAPNTIADANNLPWPRSMPTWLYRIT